MRGLLEKILRETGWFIGLFGVGLFLVTALLTFILPQLQDGIDDIFSQIPLAKRMIGALLGTEIGETLTAQMMQAILFVHPTILVIVWAYIIVFCTRVPAGEVDRGTIDILMSWPLSRRQVYLCESLVCLGAGLFLITMGWLGHLATSGAMPEDLRPRGSGVVLVYLNFFAVYVAVAGTAFLVSALSDRRGRAVGVIAAFLVASFLLNFIAPFYAPAKSIDFLSVLTYYRPAEVLINDSIPRNDLLVLLGVGCVAWIAGGEVFRRRSLCTV